jgi:hypothetical protein
MNDPFVAHTPRRHRPPRDSAYALQTRSTRLDETRGRSSLKMPRTSSFCFFGSWHRIDLPQTSRDGHRTRALVAEFHFATRRPPRPPPRRALTSVNWTDSILTVQTSIQVWFKRQLNRCCCYEGARVDPIRFVSPFSGRRLSPSSVSIVHAMGAPRAHLDRCFCDLCFGVGVGTVFVQSHTPLYFRILRILFIYFCCTRGGTRCDRFQTVLLNVSSNT